jgi:hypothetical protein
MSDKVVRKFLGRVGVDSGRLFICGPCLLPHFRLNDSGTVESDDARATDLIVQTHTPDGDGLFAVFEERSNGRIRLVVELTEAERFTSG